jgi:hypothetical protein
MKNYIISGKTTDNKIVIQGLFRLVNQEGVSIPDFLEMCNNQNMIPDWIDFCSDALKNQWNPKTIINRLDLPLLDIYGQEFHDIVINKLKKILNTN